VRCRERKTNKLGVLLIPKHRQCYFITSVTLIRPAISSLFVSHQTLPCIGPFRNVRQGTSTMRPKHPEMQAFALERACLYVCLAGITFLTATRLDASRDGCASPRRVEVYLIGCLL
jgi:hypothetical protein